MKASTKKLHQGTKSKNSGGECLFLHIFLKLVTVHPVRDESLLERMALLAGRVTSAVTLVQNSYAGSKVQGTFHRSKVQVTVPSINYQTTQIPLNLMEHSVKRLGLRDTFNAIHLSVSWWPYCCIKQIGYSSQEFAPSAANLAKCWVCILVCKMNPTLFIQFRLRLQLCVK